MFDMSNSTQSPTKSSNSTKAFDLGPLGFMISVNPKIGVAEAPHPVLILDRSGSMGAMSSQIVNRIYPEVLRAAGCPSSTKATIVTFDSETERRDVPISSLSTIAAGSRGQTFMAPVFPILKRILSEVSGRSLSILAISDGELHDPDESLIAAKKIVNDNAASVKVLSVRIGTGNGDTKALMQIAQFATDGVSEVLSVSNIGHLSNILCEKMRSRKTASLVGTGLRRMPGDVRSGRLQVDVGVETFVLVDSLDGLSLNGKELKVVVRPLIEEGPIGEFLHIAHARLRVMSVANVDPVKLADCLDWFSELANQVAQHTIDVSDEAALNARARALALIRAVESRRGTVLSRIGNLRNQDRVGALNSAQQAAWINGTLDLKTNSSAAKGLARRVGDNLDFDAMVVAALAKFLDSPEVTDRDENAPASYITLETLSELMQSLRLLRPVVNDVTAIEVLSLVGGVGVCYSAQKGAFPDPWSYVIDRVYAGTSYLSEADLVTANLSEKTRLDLLPAECKQAQLELGTAVYTLRYPGTEGFVTGVVPIWNSSSLAYDEYTQGSLQRVAELHASLSIRGILAPVPYDSLARAASAFFAVCNQLDVPDERRRAIAAQLRGVVRGAMTTYAKSNLYDLVTGLRSESPRAFFTGDLGVSGFLKPLATLLCSPECDVNNLLFVRTAMRAIYSLAAYRSKPKNGMLPVDPDRVRSAGSPAQRDHPGVGVDQVALPVDGMDYGDAICNSIQWLDHSAHDDHVLLMALLDIDTSRLSPLTPLFEPDLPCDLSSIDIRLILDQCFERASRISWMPHPDRIAAPVTLLFKVCDAYGIDTSFMRLCAAVEALSSNSESDVVDKDARVWLWPDYCDVNAWFDRINSIVRKTITDFDNQRRQIKASAENEQRASCLVDALIDAPFDQFLLLLGGHESELGGMVDRSAPGFGMLLARLLNVESPCKARLSKLTLIMIGRDSTMQPVWAKGTVFIASPETFRLFEATYKAIGGDWNALIAARREFSEYTYRESGVPNRHRHSNARPSYFAYGYVSLDAFRKDSSPEAWAEYCTVHHDCCGLGQKIKATHGL